jgi:4-aminobutyrate aminotransferase-like enzyme
MNEALHHRNEAASNAHRDSIALCEARALRTFTPTQAVLARSAGIYHWTSEGRRLYDFASGVLVANLGHNPKPWLERFIRYMGWPSLRDSEEMVWPKLDEPESNDPGSLLTPSSFLSALPMTAYNAISEVEVAASRRLVDLLQGCPGGGRLQQVMWAASGSEAVQKALWAALARDRSRDIILATRFGFHGKKGLAGATTGCETDRERDPRVRFISFPSDECQDVSCRGRPFDPLPYQRELEALHHQFGRKLAVLITEPYLGGGGSYHPPPEYLQLLQRFCRAHDLIFILDEVQSNFGRTGELFAFETYGLEPDVVVLGKGLANGAPGAAAVGPAELFASLGYGEASDTYSGNPLVCAAVLATLDLFETMDVLPNVRRVSPLIEAGLNRLKDFPFIRHVRGEKQGMVWGVETAEIAGRSAADWANACVLACYRGDGNDGIHLLGPLAQKVIRVAPPLVISEEEARRAMTLMYSLLQRLVPQV